MDDYIPDLTERYPEGFNYYGGGSDDFEDTIDDLGIDEEEIEAMKPTKFEVGQEYEVVGWYGGVTYYKVEAIERGKNRIKLSETWFDVDGTGKRPAKWHKLEVDALGNERAVEWTSEEYGDIYIYSYECN